MRQLDSLAFVFACGSFYHGWAHGVEYRMRMALGTNPSMSVAITAASSVKCEPVCVRCATILKVSSRQKAHRFWIRKPHVHRVSLRMLLPVACVQLSHLMLHMRIWIKFHQLYVQTHFNLKQTLELHPFGNILFNKSRFAYALEWRMRTRCGTGGALEITPSWLFQRWPQFLHFSSARVVADSGSCRWYNIVLQELVAYRIIS